MNKRFLSTLLTGAIFLAATSMFVSCKDYDDDIKNLQAQIDKAALKSQVDALQTTLSQVQAAAATKAELEAAKTALTADITKAQNAADAAGQKAAQAINDAAKAQNAADAAQAFAETVKLTADAAKALAEAAATKDELAAAKTELKGLIDGVKETAESALALAQKAATKEELAAAAEELAGAAAAAQATADEALEIAQAAATKAEFDKAVGLLTDAAAAAQGAADKAQKDIDDFKAIAATDEEVAAAIADLDGELRQFAQDVADAAKEAAVTEAKAYADQLAEAQARVDAAQDAALATTLESYATNEAVAEIAGGLLEKLGELEEAIAATATDAAFQILSESVNNYAAQIDVMFSAVTSVELFASYSWSYGVPSLDGQLWTSSSNNGSSAQGTPRITYTTIFGIPVPTGITVDVNLDLVTNTYNGINPLTSVIYHGTVPEDSKFGDNEDAFGQKANEEIEYKKGADVKDEAELIIRVNPVNADITNADIRLINSLGEDLNDVFVVTKAERYNELLTRGSSINSGLWKLTIKAADGVTPEDWANAVIVYDGDKYVGTKKFAVAVNNTTKDNEDRFVASTFDFIPYYAEFEPAVGFGFEIDGVDVNNIRNRWTGGVILPEMDRNYSDKNPELAWLNADNAPTAVPMALTDEDTNVQIDVNVIRGIFETRRGQSFVYADVNVPFTLSNFYGLNYPLYEDNEEIPSFYNGDQIDYYYVVFDKGNAIESAPSEWNAWKDYQVEGLGVMTKADKSLTMKITSEEAHGDVVGFRVFAVNRDGTLADPDGRAFYVFVGDRGDEYKTAAANIIATETQPESEAMDVAGWFKEGVTYEFSTNNFSDENENPYWITENGEEQEFTIANAILTFYDKDGEEITTLTDNRIDGDAIKDAVTVTFKPNRNIASMLDGATYSIYIKQQVIHADDSQYLPFATLYITKVLPTEAKTLVFRPKQEGKFDNKGNWVTEDGTGAFNAYMIPNTNAWETPWALDFTETYKVSEAAAEEVSNGFKDLNNIFYNLDLEDDIEFVFDSSLYDAENDENVALTNADGNGITSGVPGNKYILNVATPFIDGKTEHGVQVYTNYEGVSTYYDKDNVLHFGKTYKVAGQQFTAVYSCWHHAIKSSNFSGKVELKWSHDGTTVNKTFADIKLENTYDNEYFGGKLSDIVSAGRLQYIAESVELNTKKDGTGLTNPYFVPEVTDNNGITFNQKGTQVDANPTANHTEYLILKFEDAFHHVITVTGEVTIVKAAAVAPAPAL